MNIRNPKYNKNGTIDVEFNHPVYGWIPFTVDENDPFGLAPEIQASIVNNEFGEVKAFVETEYVIQEVIPNVVTMRQARLALLGAGLLELIEQKINELTSPQKEAARIEWDYSSEVHRDKPFVQTLSIALGLTKEQLDNLFKIASKL